MSRARRNARAIAQWLWLGLLCTLVACGGGGSDGGSKPVPPSGNDLSATLVAPSAFATGLLGSITLSATTTGSNVASVEFQVDGQPAGAPITSPPYSTVLDTTAFASGQHVVRVRAIDSAGQASAWTGTPVLFGGGRAVPSGFTRNEAWISGLADATAFAQAADGRFFVAQQQGVLRVVKNGALLAAPFLQLTVDADGERGLLGVALHPDFASNGWIYLYYTTNSGGTHNRISRFIANGDVVSVGSEFILADLPALGATNHNGGGMHFGIDGMLYVGVGENAVPANAQDLGTPLGKLLRFNPDGTIPADNPFQATSTGLARAIWAYGLRNPYTFAVQPASGTIHINDVGQNKWEEIDVGAAGANYGWPASEGPDGVAAGLTGPIFSYGHVNANPPGSGPGGFLIGEAITGGSFYPASGGNFPAAYAGAYFFADFATQFVARLDGANGNAAYTFASLSDQPVDMLAGSDGALYVLTRSGITRISTN